MSKLPITNYQLRNSAFTLIEVTITLFIIGLLTMLFLANYRAGSRSTDLTFAAQQLASDIRLAQNNTLGSVLYNGGIVPWGVHFDTSVSNKVYYLFADLNNNKLYDAGEAVPAFGGQTMTLPASVVISGIFALAPQTNLDVTFLPPDPLTRIYWTGPVSSTSATITLQQTSTGKTKTVDVNIQGLIETN